MPTTQDKVNIWYGANGSETEERLYPEAASQTFKRGDLVYLASGLVTAAATAGVGNNVASGTKVLGIALKDASGATNTAVPVAIANPNLRWVLPVTHATPASGVTAVTEVGTTYELERTAAGKWAVPIDDTTNTKVVVSAIHPQYALGEQYGWVEVRFLDAQVDVAQ
ncbi:MAG: hypothetical protein ACHQ50_01700 [Fimbriimonadales bacterium]